MRLFGGRRAPRLSLLTWNVWFGLDHPHRRWTELLWLVGKAKPDVIAFQEVTDPFLDMLRAQAWVKKDYTISDPRGEEIDRYGTVIVTRLPIEDTTVTLLESEMGRRLVTVRARFADASWTFGAVHLESHTESAEVRGRQLEAVLSAIGPEGDAVLMGDMNFCSTWEAENRRIPPDWIDAWPAVRSDDGFTVDTELNEMRRRAKPGAKRVRFDRILVRSSNARPIEVELVGTKTIRGTKPALFPSDHFGVRATVEVEVGTESDGG